MQASDGLPYHLFEPITSIGIDTVSTSLDLEEEQTLDPFHSHHILFTADRSVYQISDQYRSEFVDTVCQSGDCHGITIVVEGGYNVLTVIQNDLKAKRPVIIIQGSGRIANILGALIEKSKESIKIK